MKDMIKLDWQPRGSVPAAEDYPVFYHFDSAGLVYCPFPTTTGDEHKYPWARLRIAPPDEQPEAKEARPADVWLNKLPEWLKKRAIGNIETSVGYLGFGAPDLLDAFNWGETKEGGDFWSEVHQGLTGTPHDVAPPEEPEAEAEADPLSEWRYALGVREAMIAASNATSAEQARRWYNDRFLEVMKREGV
jgi:hypothetical protein